MYYLLNDKDPKADTIINSIPYGELNNAEPYARIQPTPSLEASLIATHS